MLKFDLSRPAYLLLSLLLIVNMLSGCAGQVSGRALPTATALPSAAAPPAATTQPPAAVLPPAANTPESVEPRVWVSPNLPEGFRKQVPAGLPTTQDASVANLWLDVTPGEPAASGPSTRWVYAVVAPFPTLLDTISAAELKAIWAGKTTGKGTTRLLLTAGTRAVLEALWGKASPQNVQTVAQVALLDTSWKDFTASASVQQTQAADTATAVISAPRALPTSTPTLAAPVKGAAAAALPTVTALPTAAASPTAAGTQTPAPTATPVSAAAAAVRLSPETGPVLAIIPFEDIEPRWKVVSVDGQSPMEKDFQAESYPLAVPFALRANPGRQGSQAALLRGLPAGLRLPSNYDPGKLTILVMTGTTAISRHIGERMEAKGTTYPDQDIRGWLVNADLTHISNEVSFFQDCPKPGPQRADMRFCSSPKYIQLLEDVGTDIVELTGNHNLDWGYQPFLDSLAMYRQRGWKTYGGGANLDDARQPLFIENNGNKLAFIGCSPAGPAGVWATQYTPGSAPCNMDKLEQQVRKLRADGYLPIVTFQAVETDTYKPAVAQGTPDFRRIARAGAVIVSGSQSHVPQTMTFVNDGFVHYGLGNLFFDQMSPPETRQEFIDRHVFYDGKYLGVHLFTALLEDYSRPRPMTAGERSDFLQKVFTLCNWNEP